MSVVNNLKNAITGGEWFIAYNDGATWKLAEAPENQWCADPFVIQDGDEYYIFAEQYLKDKDKGCIGYFKFVDGIPVNQGIIIETSYHMSYPDVFRYKDMFYMIPESSANSTVDLYVAEKFPDKWKKVKSLISGEKLVDTTVYENEDGFFLISYKVASNEVRVYSLDMERIEVKQISRKKYDKNVGRPGGRLFVEGGKLLRPAQDCSRKYGEALIIYQVDDLNYDGNYIEHEVKRIEACEFGISKNPERVHQITIAGQYEVVDVLKEKLELLHAIRIYIRSRKK